VLRLLHLSDIHFSAYLETAPDLDLELAVRRKMLLDIGLMRISGQPFDAIVVVGDIGNHGKPEDYTIAAEFIDAVVELTGCPPNRVSCVPGNHDVDRDAQIPAHAAIRHQLRTVEPREISDTLLACLRDPQSADVLLRPFEAYNEFALTYGCDISREALVWGPKTLPLGEKTVYIHGINSAWIADTTDSADEDSKKLVVGAFQFAGVASEPDAISITLCHHPPRWTRDAEEVAAWAASAELVLTGHEHEAAAYQSDDGRTVFVASGAVNPSRSEKGWRPAYNVIELDVSEDATTLVISIYARTWQERAEFGPSAADESPQTFVVPLTLSSVSPPEQPPDLPAVPPARPYDSAERSLAYAIMRTPPDRRRRVARELGLLPDDAPTGLEADRMLLRLAAERGKLPELASRLVGDFGDG
jgi:predicted phosphodiesterase